MAEFHTNDINEAKRRVEEMRKKSMDYVSDDNSANVQNHNKGQDNQDSPLSFLKDLTGGLFSSSADDSAFGLILALILILSKEGADNKLILALLYILL